MKRKTRSSYCLDVVKCARFNGSPSPPMKHDYTMRPLLSVAHTHGENMQDVFCIRSTTKNARAWRDVFLRLLPSVNTLGSEMFVCENNSSVIIHFSHHAFTHADPTTCVAGHMVLGLDHTHDTYAIQAPKFNTASCSTKLFTPTVKQRISLFQQMLRVLSVASVSDIRTLLESTTWSSFVCDEFARLAWLPGTNDTPLIDAIFKEMPSESRHFEFVVARVLFERTFDEEFRVSNVFAFDMWQRLRHADVERLSVLADHAFFTHSVDTTPNNLTSLDTHVILRKQTERVLQADVFKQYAACYLLNVECDGNRVDQHVRRLMLESAERARITFCWNLLPLQGAHVSAGGVDQMRQTEHGSNFVYTVDIETYMCENARQGAFRKTLRAITDNSLRICRTYAEQVDFEESLKHSVSFYDMYETWYEGTYTETHSCTLACVDTTCCVPPAHAVECVRTELSWVVKNLECAPTSPEYFEAPELFQHIVQRVERLAFMHSCLGAAICKQTKKAHVDAPLVHTFFLALVEAARFSTPLERLGALFCEALQAWTSIEERQSLRPATCEVPHDDACYCFTTVLSSKMFRALYEIHPTSMFACKFMRSSQVGKGLGVSVATVCEFFDAAFDKHTVFKCTSRTDVDGISDDVYEIRTDDSECSACTAVLRRTCTTEMLARKKHVAAACKLTLLPEFWDAFGILLNYCIVNGIKIRQRMSDQLIAILMNGNEVPETTQRTSNSTRKLLSIPCHEIQALEVDFSTSTAPKQHALTAHTRLAYATRSTESVGSLLMHPVYELIWRRVVTAFTITPNVYMIMHRVCGNDVRRWACVLHGTREDRSPSASDIQSCLKITDNDMHVKSVDFFTRWLSKDSTASERSIFLMCITGCAVLRRDVIITIEVKQHSDNYMHWPEFQTCTTTLKLYTYETYEAFLRIFRESLHVCKSDFYLA